MTTLLEIREKVRELNMVRENGENTAAHLIMLLHLVNNITIQ